MTVAELITSYRLTNLTDRRREDVRHARWWIEHFGTLPVSALTQARILHAIDQVRAEGRTGARATSTIGFYLRFLRRATAWAACVALLPADPCAGIPLPKEQTPPMRVLTEEEEAQLCQALGRPYRLWVRFAVLTGLEKSEQFALLWRSVFQSPRGQIVPEEPQKNHRKRRGDRRQKNEGVSYHGINIVLMTTPEAHDGLLN